MKKYLIFILVVSCAAGGALTAIRLYSGRVCGLWRRAKYFAPRAVLTGLASAVICDMYDLMKKACRK